MSHSMWVLSSSTGHGVHTPRSGSAESSPLDMSPGKSPHRLSFCKVVIVNKQKKNISKKSLCSDKYGKHEIHLM